jgi:2-polyprenyl-3-methyl-5-hydroxy-6-metoxy-1,4-benzoquinol methylase
VIGSILLGLIGLGGGLLTRRSAKEGNAVTGYDSLTQRLEHRVERLESRETRREQLAVAHSSWDDQIYDQAKAAGWDVSRPPPLT